MKMLSARFVWFLSSLSISIFLKNAEGRLTGEEIVGGDLAIESQFPYQALVYIVDVSAWACGGAIIGEKHILTAAHCVLGKDGFLPMPIQIKVGVTKGNQSTEGFVVERVYIPWKYTPKGARMYGKFNVTHDIAVLKLSKSLDLSPESKLKAVKLPQKVEVRDPKTNKLEWRYPKYKGKKATISGYGYNIMNVYQIDEGPLEENGTTDYQLRYAVSTVMPNEYCREIMPTKDITDNILCAQMTPRKDNMRGGVCSADSGGPLVVDDMLIGVLIKSPMGCSEKKKPARYTRVSSFVPFIENAMKEKDLSKMRVVALGSKGKYYGNYEMVKESENSEMAKTSFNPNKKY